MNMKTNEHSRGRRARMRKLALLATVSITGTIWGNDAFAVDRTFTGATWATWDNAANWSPSGVPGNGDNARIAASNGQFRAVTYSGNPFLPTLNSLTVDAADMISTSVPLMDHVQGNINTNNTYVGVGRYG